MPDLVPPIDAPKMSKPSLSEVDWLATLTSDAKDIAPLTIIFGPPGCGKSSLAAQAEKPVFVIDSQELGIHRLKSAGSVPADVKVMPACETVDDMMGQLEALATGKHDRKTVIVDTLGGAERLISEYICESNYKGEWGEKGFGGFGRGFRDCIPEWRKLVNVIDRIRNKGTRVILLAHSQVKTHRNPTGDDYQRFFPDMNEKAWGIISKAADAVFFLTYQVAVMDDSSQGPKKARGGQDRVLYTEWNAAWEAKNRDGMPPKLMGGKTAAETYNVIKKHMKGM